MLEDFRQAPGEHLDPDGYSADFVRFVGDIKSSFTKLECAQHYSESGNPSWEAFAAGRWDEALRLMNADDGDLLHQLVADGRIDYRRVRVVTLPLTPYIQWELNAFQRRNAVLGEQIRVVVDESNQLTTLPELVVIDDTVAFEVLYDDAGVHSGARLVAEPETVAAARRGIMALFDRGVPLVDFYTSEVADLPAPRGQQA